MKEATKNYNTTQILVQGRSFSKSKFETPAGPELTTSSVNLRSKKDRSKDAYV